MCYPLFYNRKADNLLEMVSEDNSELRRHKLAYGERTSIVCLYTCKYMYLHVCVCVCARAHVK